MNTAIKLGDRARDIYTGFAGVVVARTEWLYGCMRLTIESTALKDGKPIGCETFDEQRIELERQDEPHVTPESTSATGGPHVDPARRTDPR